MQVPNLMNEAVRQYTKFKRVSEACVVIHCQTLMHIFDTASDAGVVVGGCEGTLSYCLALSIVRRT